mgnify:CR=1 FL=1|jgi:phosphopantothenate synthetase
MNLPISNGVNNMKNLINQLKEMKNATQSEYNELINQYANKEVLNKLKELGIKKEDISEEEFNALLADQIKESKVYANAALGATGLFLFLEFLG